MFVALKTFQCPICFRFFNKKMRAPNGMCLHCDKEMRETRESRQIPLPL